MPVELGARVHSQDGQDAGTIKYLILDPPTGQVKSVVVERGHILPDDIEIPRDALQEEDPHTVRVAYTAEQLKTLPRFDESQYTTPPSSTPYPAAGNPFGGLLWPIGYPSTAYMPGMYPAPLPFTPETSEDPVSQEVAEKQRQADLANAVIAIGSDVISQDGEKVGEVENIVFDTATGRPITLVLRRGFVVKENIDLPATAIASVDDEVVYLNLTKEQVKAAPHEPTVPML